MSYKPRILCVIPARGGSKRLPRKNIKIIYGKPMIQWVYEAAKNASLLDRIILSTEDDAIANTCANFGFTDWIKRPPHLAADNTTTAEVIIDLLQNNSINNEAYAKYYDLIVLMQVTSPLVTPKDVNMTINAALNNPQSNCISTSENNEIVPNGAVYVIKPENLISTQKFAIEGGAFYKMPAIRSFDIDTLKDFQMAEAAMTKLYR